MRHNTRIRRVLVAFTALVAGALLFRAQIAQALIVRGDDFLYRHNADAAVQRYRRALLIAPGSEIAADRILFVLIMQRNPKSIRQGIDTANAYLLHAPNSAVVLADRALCLLIRKDYRAAERDFRRAATQSHDPQDYVFAGWAARRSGDWVSAAQSGARPCVSRRATRRRKPRLPH